LLSYYNFGAFRSKVDGPMISKRTLNRESGCGLASFSIANGPEAGSCEYDNENSGYVKDAAFFAG
jgi:hypothetical protein